MIEDIIEEPTTRILPMLISTVYTAHDGYTGRIAIQPNAEHTVYLTIIHDSITGTASYELRGNSSPLEIAAHDYDAIIVLCRYEGDIVASAILQVEFRLVEQIGAILNPLSINNIIIDQHKAEATPPITGEIEAVKINITVDEARASAILDAIVKGIEVAQ